MDRAISSIASVLFVNGINRDINELKSEIIRKSIHMVIAVSPLMAGINKAATVVLLFIGILGYSCMEYLRLSGIKIPVISSITSIASRPHDNGRFVMGPVTLGLGALIALLLYPSDAAMIAIYALAFGDSIACLVGKVFGRLRPFFLFGKSIEGSIACFLVVFIITYAVSGSMYIALIAAFTAMAVEAFPLGDYDNLAIPLSVGLAVQIALLF